MSGSGQNSRKPKKDTSPAKKLATVPPLKLDDLPLTDRVPGEAREQTASSQPRENRERALSEGVQELTSGLSKVIAATAQAEVSSMEEAVKDRAKTILTRYQTDLDAVKADIREIKENHKTLNKRVSDEGRGSAIKALEGANTQLTTNLNTTKTEMMEQIKKLEEKAEKVEKAHSTLSLEFREFRETVEAKIKEMDEWKRNIVEPALEVLDMIAEKMGLYGDGGETDE